MSDFTLPSSSFNTPHGRQFGREAAEFTPEAGINPELWNEMLSEQPYEATPPREATYDDTDRDHVHTVSEQSRAVFEISAKRSEREVLAERETLIARAKGISQWIRFDRDWEEAA